MSRSRAFARLSESEIPQNASRAIAMIVVSRLFGIPVIDAIVKLLQVQHGYTAWQVMWARFATQSLILLPLCLWHHGGRALVGGASLQIIGRGLLQFTAVALFYSSIAFVPLGDAAGVIFLAPILTVVLAALALGERVAPRRWITTIIGFIAVLLIMRPGYAHFHPAYLLLIVCALTIASYNVLTRLLRQTPPLLLYTYQVLVGFIPLTLCAPLYLVVPRSASDAALLLLVGLLALANHGLVILAMRIGEASMLAPFLYLDIAGQVFLGFLLFGEIPDAATCLGIGVITAAGVWLSVMEGRAKAREAGVQQVVASPMAEARSWPSSNAIDEPSMSSLADTGGGNPPTQHPKRPIPDVSVAGTSIMVPAADVGSARLAANQLYEEKDSICEGILPCVSATTDLQSNHRANP